MAAEFASLLKGGSRILVSMHTSLAALKIIEMLGGDPVCYLHGELPGRYRFLPGIDRIHKIPEDRGESWDRALIVDCGNFARIGEVAGLIHPDAVLINVDHHADNGLFGRLNFVRPEAASTTQILFELIGSLDLPVDTELAELLYTGLMTDTGGFRYANTNEEAFDAAARLVRLGAQPHKIAEAVYASNSPQAAKLLAEALASLELTCGGRLAAMTVNASGNPDEWEDLSEFTLSVDGVIASALFRIRDDVVRVSLRGRGPVEVAGIAKMFGGGGHPKAAGFTTQGDPEKIRASVIKALTEEVEKRDAPPAE